MGKGKKPNGFFQHLQRFHQCLQRVPNGQPTALAVERKTVSVRFRVKGHKFGNKNGNQVQVLYGVCDGATHSSAFFNQQGQINWMADNPYNNNNPIFWLSDPPHMIKKLRNFIISQNRHLCHQGFQISLSHLMEVAERGLTKLSYKHLFLTSRNKMF